MSRLRKDDFDHYLVTLFLEIQLITLTVENICAVNFYTVLLKVLTMKK